MKEHVPLETALRSLRLTDYEIKAWLTLLKYGTLTAERISELGAIPLPRVYDTIAELQKKGFVLIGKSRPKMFRPVNAAKALSHLIDLRKKEFEEKISLLKSNAANALAALSTIETVKKPEHRRGVWTAEKRLNIIKILREQVSAAKREILIFAGDMSWASERIPFIKEIVRRGVRIRVIAQPPDSREVIGNLKRLSKLKVEVKTGYGGKLRGHIVDKKIASIAIKTPMEAREQSGSDLEHKYELLIFDNPALVSAFKENFEFWWKALK
jgi:sugar-specific transcriptional regulator TrmB